MAKLRQDTSIEWRVDAVKKGRVGEYMGVWFHDLTNPNQGVSGAPLSGDRYNSSYKGRAAMPSLQKDYAGLTNYTESTRRINWASSSDIVGEGRGDDLDKKNWRSTQTVLKSRTFRQSLKASGVSGVSLAPSNRSEFTPTGTGNNEINYGATIKVELAPTGTGYINFSAISEYWNNLFIGTVNLTNIKRLAIKTDFLDNAQSVTGGWLATKITDAGVGAALNLYPTGTNLFMQYHPESGVTDRHAIVGSGKVPDATGKFGIFGSGTAIPAFGVIDMVNPVTGWKIENGVNDVLGFYNPSTMFPVQISVCVLGVSGGVN